MPEISRRDLLAGASLAPAAGAAAAPPRAGIKLAIMLGPGQTRNIKLTAQMGVTHAIVGVAGALARVPRERYAETLAGIKAEFTSAGLKIAGVESHPVPAERIKLGAEGRDTEIENYRAAIEALGGAGIPLLCYNFMAGLGWYRTSVSVPARGGALTSEFDYRAAQRQGLTKFGEIGEDKVWASLEYFLKAVIPVAEKAGVKMALHPDDPPISPLRGIGRILTSAANYRRVLNIVPSPVNGITFCQANFKAMGENIQALAREWCREKKIFFVHFRDIDGTRERFVETFHDDTPTDMGRMLEIYHAAGFDGPMRPDHAPTMEGESNDNPGYAITGKVLAIGYMKGLMRAQRIPYE